MQGLITDRHLKKTILDKFIVKFVKSEYEFYDPTGSLQLLWCHFSCDSKVYSTEELFQYPLNIKNNVYFYNERTEEMYHTSFEDVSDFICDFEPWDVVDAEIFDDTLDWVIAVTHEDLSKVFGIDVAIDEYDYEKDMNQ